MLLKKNRAGTKEVEKVFKEGAYLSFPSFSFKFLLNQGLASPKISVIAPKSVAKLAAKRNLLRRLGYVALGKYIEDFPIGFVGALTFKKYQDDPSLLEHEIKTILRKIH